MELRSPSQAIIRLIKKSQQSRFNTQQQLPSTIFSVNYSSFVTTTISRSPSQAEFLKGKIVAPLIQLHPTFRLILLCLSIWLNGDDAYSQHEWSESAHNSVPWVFDQNSLTPSIEVPTNTRAITIKPGRSWLKKRLHPSKTNGVEPLHIWIKKRHVKRIAKKLAQKGKVRLLRQAISQALQKVEKNVGYVNFTKIPFTLWDQEMVLKHFRKKHLKIQLKTAEILQPQFNQLIVQLSKVISKSDLFKIKQLYQRKKPIHLDQHMLPKFAENAVGSFSPFRGPNCFHASLAFHSLKATKNPRINITKESGYHWAMINYDELWRTLDRDFYPINPKKYPLKYGDLMIYFDVPDNTPSEHKPYFRWIKHAAVYLFNDYAFSKGSKSANTSYAIHTISEEWKTWAKHSKKLGLRIFRKKRKYVTKRMNPPLKDWIY